MLLTLVLSFFVYTLAHASVLKILVVSEDNTEAMYLEFEENEVHRATWGDPASSRESTVHFVIPKTIVDTKYSTPKVFRCPAGVKPGVSIVFAKDEIGNTVSIKPGFESIQTAYFRPYNETADKGKYYTEFTLGSGSSAIRYSVLTEDKTKETTENECLYVYAAFEYFE